MLKKKSVFGLTTVVRALGMCLQGMVWLLLVPNKAHVIGSHLSLGLILFKGPQHIMEVYPIFNLK